MEFHRGCIAAIARSCRGRRQGEHSIFNALDKTYLPRETKLWKFCGAHDECSHLQPGEVGGVETLSVVVNEVLMHGMEVGHEREGAVNREMRVFLRQTQIFFMGMRFISTQKQEMIAGNLL